MLIERHTLLPQRTARTICISSADLRAGPARRPVSAAEEVVRTQLTNDFAHKSSSRLLTETAETSGSTLAEGAR